MNDGILNYVSTEEDHDLVNRDPFKDCKIIKSAKVVGNDTVNRPNHYQSKSGLECKDAIEAAIENLVGAEAFYTGNAIKYLWRWKKKNGEEDLRKAKKNIDFILDMHLKEEMDK